MTRFLMLLVICLAATSSVAKDKLDITFENTGVVARVAPAATAVFFAIIQERREDTVRLVRPATTIVDEDRDGLVRYPLDHAAPPSSLWLVVDLASGDYAVKSPSHNTFLRRRTLPPGAFHSRGNGTHARFNRDLTLLIVWVVRPGVGAWYSTVKDGSPIDGDGVVDGRVTALLSKLKPLGDSPPAPDDFSSGDVVALVNPFALKIYDGKVK